MVILPSGDDSVILASSWNMEDLVHTSRPTTTGDEVTVQCCGKGIHLKSANGRSAPVRHQRYATHR